MMLKDRMTFLALCVNGAASTTSLKRSCQALACMSSFVTSAAPSRQLAPECQVGVGVMIYGPLYHVIC